MRLYEITNGYIGESHVKVFAIAETAVQARSIAEEKFRAEAFYYSEHKGHEAQRYPSAYWENLEAKILCMDVTQEWASDVRDY